jgi:hypothetical protein
MMASEQYFFNLLSQQDLAAHELQQLRNLRDQIQQQLSSILAGNPRFYYAGSYGKNTMIRARYDLDIVVYWPYTVTYTLEDIYSAVGNVLKKHWKIVTSKTVSWEIPFQGNFHVDVVPGRALDASNFEANLYRTDKGTSMKTSLKTHIDTVRNSGRRDVIRLMKLWRERNNVPFKKSFLLEMMTIEGCKGLRTSDLEVQFNTALQHIYDRIISCNVLDPANSNNSLSDDINASDRQKIQAAVKLAL